MRSPAMAERVPHVSTKQSHHMTAYEFASLACSQQTGVSTPAAWGEGEGRRALGTRHPGRWIDRSGVSGMSMTMNSRARAGNRAGLSASLQGGQ